jgi:hypothetical protein
MSCPSLLRSAWGGGQQREREIPDGWQYVQKLHCYLKTHDGIKNIGLYEH